MRLVAHFQEITIGSITLIINELKANKIHEEHKSSSSSSLCEVKLTKRCLVMSRLSG